MKFFSASGPVFVFLALTVGASAETSTEKRSLRRLFDNGQDIAVSRVSGTVVGYDGTVTSADVVSQGESSGRGGSAGSNAELNMGAGWDGTVVDAQGSADAQNGPTFLFPKPPAKAGVDVRVDSQNVIVPFFGGSSNPVSGRSDARAEGGSPALFSTGGSASAKAGVKMVRQGNAFFGPVNTQTETTTQSKADSGVSWTPGRFFPLV